MSESINSIPKDESLMTASHSPNVDSLSPGMNQASTNSFHSPIRTNTSPLSINSPMRTNTSPLPMNSRQIKHARFDNDGPNRIPGLSTSRPGSPLNVTSVASSRPTLPSRVASFAQSSKRKSIARSLTSYSLYSNFAGEHLDDAYLPARSRRSSVVSEARRRRFSGNPEDEKSIGEEQVEDAIEEDLPTASVGKAMFMFLKAFIGSGVLFLPKAFQNGGLALSIVLMIIIGAICFFAFLLLVRTQSVVGGSYGDIGGILFGKPTRYIVLFFIVISQMGFVCSYFIFVSGNLVSVVDVLSHCTSHIAQKYYVWFPLILLIPFSLVRHMARLSFAAIIADIFILFGLVCIIYFTADQLHNEGVGPNVVAVNPVNFGLMIGTATFSFEGIGLVIPIVESMEEPEKFPIVLTAGMIIIGVVYILIGTISYLAYGDRIQAAVIYNFPPDNGLTITVQLLYSLAICLTAPLMLFPALKIIENGLFAKCRSGRDSLAVKWSKNVYRTLLCVLCATLAFGIGGDNLDKFVSLVGSVACVPLCFIFPGMFHYKVATNRTQRILDVLLVIFGVVIMVYTLYVTINSFIRPTDTGEPLPPYCPLQS